MKEKRYVKIASCLALGRAPKFTDNALNVGIIHHKLGLLSWELDDGTILVCRSYHEYKKKKEVQE